MITFKTFKIHTHSKHSEFQNRLVLRVSVKGSGPVSLGCVCVCIQAPGCVSSLTACPFPSAPTLACYAVVGSFSLLRGISSSERSTLDLFCCLHILCAPPGPQGHGFPWGDSPGSCCSSGTGGFRGLQGSAERLDQFTFSTSNEQPFLPRACRHLLVSGFLTSAHLVGVNWYLTVVRFAFLRLLMMLSIFVFVSGPNMFQFVSCP